VVVRAEGPAREVLELVKRCLSELESIDESLQKEDIDLNEVKKRIEEIRPFVSAVSAKWIPEILYALALKREMSFNELKNTLGISSRVLSDKLKELRELGLVEKVEVEGKRGAYVLTEKGKKVVYALTPFLIAVYINKE